MDKSNFYWYSMGDAFDFYFIFSKWTTFSTNDPFHSHDLRLTVAENVWNLTQWPKSLSVWTECYLVDSLFSLFFYEVTHCCIALNYKPFCSYTFCFALLWFDVRHRLCCSTRQPKKSFCFWVVRYSSWMFCFYWSIHLILPGMLS